MITIHEKNSIVFDTLGLGALLPSLCTIREELNGLYELELTHPYDEWGKWKNIEKERIIFASTPRGKQPFRIYHVKPDMYGVKVNARHIFYDLLDNLCLSVNTTGTPQSILNVMKSSFAYSTPFGFLTNMFGTGRVALKNENPVSTLLGMDQDKDSFVKAFGGEILRDGFTVTMKTSIGQDRGVAIRYGKNLVGLEISEDISEVATRIYAYGKDGVAMSGGYRDSQYINAYANPKITIFEDNSLLAYELPGAVQKLFDDGMGKQKRRRFRINDDTMTTIVVWSLLFCVAVVVAGMVLACYGVDVSTIVGNALALFGTELGVCGIMTIFNRHADRQDKLAEKRQEMRMRREEMKNERE